MKNDLKMIVSNRALHRTLLNILLTIPLCLLLIYFSVFWMIVGSIVYTIGVLCLNLYLDNLECNSELYK